MDPRKSIYETVFVLHPELSEEEAETHLQNVITLLEGKNSEVIRLDRGGKRRLAYVIRKQRYGYYNLIHFRATPDVPAEIERIFRLNERVMRYLTIHFEKEEQLTGFTRVPDDDGRDDDRDERRRGGGRRGDSFYSRGESRYGSRGGGRSSRADDLDDDDGGAMSSDDGDDHDEDR